MSDKPPFVIHFNPGTGHFGGPLARDGYLVTEPDGRLGTVEEIRPARRFNRLGARWYALVFSWQYGGATFTPVDTRKITPASSLSRARP